jgi:hypothetical protein
VAVDVVAPGGVAALMSGNDDVAVIVYERGVDLLERIVARVTKLIDP